MFFSSIVPKSRWVAIHLNTNLTSTFTQRAMGSNLSRAQSAQEKLSSGSRINRGADDAAGLAVSEHGRAVMKSLSRAARNLEDAYSLVDTADGAMTEIGNGLLRMRELAIQAASDTVGPDERRMIQAEFKQRQDEISRISLETEFNGVKLLDGSAEHLDIQADAGHDPSTSRITLRLDEIELQPERLGVAWISVYDKEHARESLEHVDAAQGRLASARATVGSLRQRLEISRGNVLDYQLNLGNANSRVKDTDYAEEASELAKHGLLTQSSVSVLAQANSSPGGALKLLS